MKTDRGAEPATIFMAAYTNYRRDPRVRREAEALVGEGYRVVFLASRQPGEPKREAIDGVQVFKSHSLMNRRTSMASYLLNYAWFFLALMGHLIAHPLRYRLIHINNMPDFLVFAAWLPRLLGTPVIHDVHDLMPDLFQEKFRSGERHWIVGALKFQERWAGCFATAVLTVEERLKDILSRRGVPAGKIHVLMNLPDDRIFRPRSAPPTKTADGRSARVPRHTMQAAWISQSRRWRRRRPKCQESSCASSARAKSAPPCSRFATRLASARRSLSATDSCQCNPFPA
jgi:glycosyltransferase involved in cell wall biosynthesis